ncbi:MAG: right-handed parallel beta-helix repeat-containing protein [Butyrivibrio sp.]|nr:right-handed parallel beta-helix repeat-containing protein [Butyrivibrio sp.]
MAAEWISEQTTELLPDGTRFSFWEEEPVFDRTYHVAQQAAGTADRNPDGSEESPFPTIQQAAEVAGPGTRVLIHAGTYRECVRPKKGGSDAAHPVSYEAAGDGEVFIKASEVVTDFIPSTGWSCTFPGGLADPEVRIYAHHLDPDMFRGYNPFCCVNILHDRLFIEYDKTDMSTYLNRRGMVFCDGKPLQQVALYRHMAETPGSYWVEANGQTVHFRLPGDEDPADHCIEITVREQCFAPDIPFLSYIRVRGLTCAHAATGAPVPQRGAISAFRGHHWIIEDCTIDWSNAVGIDVGNECWHHTVDPEQLIGYSVIRRCHLKDCGVCGIAGLFARELLVEDNLIEGTGWQKMELSWEAGAIKLHNSVNSLFRRNVFRGTFRADHLWLDCGNENNRITCNLFLDGREQREAIFIECTREGINLIDHNIFWNIEGRFDPAKIPVEPGSSGWYKSVENDTVNGYAVYGEGTDHLRIACNLIGCCRGSGYYAKPVAFRMSPMDRGGTSRDARIAGNLFYECEEAAITFPTRDNRAEGNLYVREKGGYLRVMYPAPEVCLHLPAWQEFEGFDRLGQEGWFDLTLDTEQLTLAYQEQSSPRPMWPNMNQRHFAESMTEVKPVSSTAICEALGIEERVLFGERFAETVLPGFCGEGCLVGEALDIDPRR